MKRIFVGISFTIIFLLSYFVIPEVLMYLNWYVGIVPMMVSILNQLVITSIPVLIILSVTEIPLLKIASYALLGINVGFLLIALTQNSGPIAGYSYIFLVLGNITLFVVGLNLGNVFYFGRRVRVFVVILSFVIFFRYSPILQPIYSLIQEYGASNNKPWNVYEMAYKFQSMLFILMFAFEVLTLDAVLDEKEELGYE